LEPARPARRATHHLVRQAFALLAAAGVQLAFLALFGWRTDESPLPVGGDARPPIVVTMATPPRPVTRPQLTSLGRLSAAQVARRTPSAPAGATLAPLVPAVPSASQAGPSPAPSPGLGPGYADISAALRHGGVGCADAAASRLSQKERDGCRDRLAMNAMQAPHLEGMAPEKLAYYQAVAKAEDDWRSGRDPGHLPFVFCGMHPGHGRANVEPAPAHALRLGPCYIEPPKGSLDVDVDTPRPGDPRPYPNNTTAPFAEPIPNPLHQR